MNEKHENIYISQLNKGVCEKISDCIYENTIEAIINQDLINTYLVDRISEGFNKYYFSTLKNEREFLEKPNFFRKFKKEYSLQAIDYGYLDELEKHKHEILENIRNYKFVDLYFKFFHKAQIKYGEGIKGKNLGSFFVKLVHTFRPKEFCALDNPIKNFFGLKRESFLIAFFIISEAYKNWATENIQTLDMIRCNFKEADKEQLFNHEMITDMKLLDLIFWSQSNISK